ncbi:hypothetical protein MA16_Dca022163 [Dendrobium catenatum]|uniref:Uncharacterized protein n=1 Tax=Dendrobium catenatum TaxID=906689 RepID=A0A2I0VQQ9_9ASPA|nr:hypothetical protein MA16_Dca022163 [Dendrobium catenatum]
MEALLQVRDMLRPFETLYQHVINIHLHITSNKGFKNLIHETLISCSNILEPEGHHPITIQSFVCLKCCCFFVSQIHLDLVVTRVGVHEAQHLMSMGGID